MVWQHQYNVISKTILMLIVMCLLHETNKQKAGGHSILEQSTQWRSSFKDLESEGVLDSSSELRMECHWYCYASILQNDLNIVIEHWNSYRIRKSRHNTVSGRPDSLFYLPEHHGAVGNLLLKIPQSEIDYVSKQSSDEISNGEIMSSAKTKRIQESRM